MFKAEVTPTEQPLRIRDAVPQEAPGIGGLVREAFDPRYLLSSPYATESGDALLASQAAAPRSASGLRRLLRVAVRATELEGVAISSKSADGLHLDFIASRATCGPRGVGSALLDDAKGLSNGRVTLNVFRNNRRACAFYARRGFRESQAVWFRVVNMGALPTSAAIAGGDLREAGIRARQDEVRQGFGNLTLEVDSASYELGLVGGRSIRIRSASGADVADLVKVLRGTFPERTALVLPVDTPAQGLPISFEDELLTMEWAGD